MPRRKKKGPSKLGAVRELLATNPDPSPAEIVAALKAKGLEISREHASNYKIALTGRSKENQTQAGDGSRRAGPTKGSASSKERQTDRRRWSGRRYGGH